MSMRAHYSTALSFLSAKKKHLSALRGKQRLAAAFGFGLLLALCFTPFHLIPLLWICFPALVVLLQTSQRLRDAFWVGFCFAFGYLLISFYWIANSMFVDIGRFWWAVPFAVAGLPAFFAVYYALAVTAVRRWFNLERADGILMLGLLWFTADYLRSHLFTGFPWDVLGYAWDGVLPVLQLTCVIGIYGLSLITVLAALLPAFFWVSRTGPARYPFWMSAGCMGLLLFGGVCGTVRLALAPKDIVPDVRLRLVQTALQQTSKWSAEDRDENFKKLVKTTFVATDFLPTLYLWPETATPFFLTEEIQKRLEISSLLPLGAKLITGALQRQWVASTKDKNKGHMEYYNSMIVIDDRAHVIAGYDKFHLVPFGEYIPFKDFVPLPTIDQLGMSFTAGDGLRTLDLSDLPPFSPLICYEAIFSNAVASRDVRPRFLVNLTNDAWYQGTIGPAQHFAIARVRAIEEGLPLVRVANLGRTAVVDGYGRIRAETERTKSSFVDSDLPKAVQYSTIFSLYGNIILIFLFSLGLFSSILCRKLRPEVDFIISNTQK